MASVEVKKKRLGVSKNRKKSWRKHVDLKEIEEHLDDKRKDEITGGPARDKPDAKLFFVDKESQPALTDDKPNWKTRQLRCFKILLPDSLVPPMIPRTIRKRKPHIPPKPKETEPDTKVKGLKKRLQALQNRKLNFATKRNFKVKIETLQTYDIWKSKEIETLGLKKIDPKMKEVHKDDARVKSCKTPKTYLKKTSALPPVEVPDPGASYNPSYEEYQQLVRTAHEIEVKKLKAEQKLQRSFTKYPSAAAGQDTWLVEMSQGMFDEGGENEDDEPSSGPLTINPPVRGDKRKPANKRRKEKARKKAEQEAKRQKLDVVKENDIYRLRSLKAEILSAERKSQVKQIRRRVTERLRTKYKPGVVGPNKYEAPDVEVNLSSELSGSLRALTTDGNLLLDRYKSFQRRNIIEPRLKQRRKRKYRLKTYVKRGHGDEI